MSVNLNETVHVKFVNEQVFQAGDATISANYTHFSLLSNWNIFVRRPPHHRIFIANPTLLDVTIINNSTTLRTVVGIDVLCSWEGRYKLDLNLLRGTDYDKVGSKSFNAYLPKTDITAQASLPIQI